MFSPMASFASNAGCDGCASIDQAFGSQISNVNTAVNHFNQNPVLDHAASTVMSGPNPVGRPAPMLASQPFVPVVQSGNQQAMQQMVNQAVAGSQGAESVSPPAYQQAQRPPVADQIAADAIVNHGQHLESFTVAEGSGVQVNIPGRVVLLNLALMILVALSVNEASKYYINRALSSADGQPHYYLAYALGTFTLAGVTWLISRRWLA